MSFYKYFKALPFKSFSSCSNQKITRKKNDIHLLNNDFYPSEGHCSVKINTNSYVFFGGARRSEESTWPSTSYIYNITFDIEDDDVSIETITKLKQSGAIFPPLQGSSAFFANDSIFVWGGLNLEQFRTTNELFQLRVVGEKCTVEIIQKNNNASISIRHMLGTVPSARCGHSFTLVSPECAILFGGVELLKGNNSFSFHHETVDPNFYVFNVNQLTWDRIPELCCKPRAYHTATYLSLGGIDSIVFIGGCFKKDNVVERISLPEIVVLKLLPQKQYQLEQLLYVNIPNVGISYHSALCVGSCIFIVGGNTDEHLTGTPNIIVLNNENMSSDLVVLESDFKCSGHSCICLTDDCVMICGGRQKQYFVYTSKPMVPGACDLNDECKIIESVETSPISWIQCEGSCKKWLHQFCVGVLNITVRGKYICKTCKANAKHHPPRSKKKKT